VRFGSKERDIETGLDYFINRYYSSIQGRFTSVDPENVGADPEYPQTWNGYSYTINNPVTYSDPDGLKVKICDTNGNCTEISDTDAKKYFFNKQYQEQSGYRIDGKGGVFDTEGNKIGTYQRTSFDDLSDQANAFIFGRGGMVERAPALREFVQDVGESALGIAALPLGLGGSGVRLGLGGAAAARQPIALLGTARMNLLNAVKSPKLREWIEYLYRKGATIGNGSTADAIRHELATGQLLSPKGHFQKGQEAIRGMEKLLRTGRLDPKDAQIAREIVSDLKNALQGK
jgi:RHS repeat-associated protein